MPLVKLFTEINFRIKLLNVTLEFRNYWLWAYHWDSYHTRTRATLYPTLGPINKTPPGPLATTRASRCHGYSRKPRFRANLPIRSYSCYQPPARLRTAYISHSFSSFISRELLKYCRPGRVLIRMLRSRFAWPLAGVAYIHKLWCSWLRHRVVIQVVTKV
jgi:hypothetical protein